MTRYLYCPTMSMDCYSMKPRPSYLYHSLCPSCDRFAVDLYSCCFFLHRRLSIYDTVVRYPFLDFGNLLLLSTDACLLMGSYHATLVMLSIWNPFPCNHGPTASSTCTAPHSDHFVTLAQPPHSFTSHPVPTAPAHFVHTQHM